MKFTDSQNGLIIEILETESSVKLSMMFGQPNKLTAIERFLNFTKRCKSMEGEIFSTFFVEAKPGYLLITGDCIQIINELNYLNYLTDTIKNQILNQYTANIIEKVMHTISPSEKANFGFNIKQIVDRMMYKPNTNKPLISDV